MTPYAQLTREELQQELTAVSAQYAALQEKKLNLNMARGKPGKVQLDMVTDIFDLLHKPEDFMFDGIDARNYGEMAGLPAARRLFAELLGVLPQQTLVGGNSSLQLMYDTIAKAYTHGLLHSTQPWSREAEIKFLCPAPGYDRHFQISQSFGMTMVTIPMTAEGPDMDAVERAVQDPAVRGMWCVPKYSNPEGVIYSDETVRRIAALHPAAPDFLLMWDNAYCVHEFDVDFVPFLNILEECEKAGNPDMPFEFASTSKVTLPGAGVSVVAASEANLGWLTRLITIQTIGFDKVNQLRHVKYLQDKPHTLALMRRHAEILAPKFHAVLQALDTEIAPLQIADWKRPHGGYFVSLDAMPGTAKRTLELCRQAGVTMTGAGATFPYGIDPRDSNIRIAPTLPPVAELEAAIAVICVCLRLSALEKLLAEQQ
ncbi:MAG: aminotransferase class I/II-fold pyridoxal phosphate-dependent enzyme [Oscillospiraceae bacterium]